MKQEIKRIWDDAIETAGNAVGETPTAATEAVALPKPFRFLSARMLIVAEFDMDRTATSVDQLYRETGPQLLAYFRRRHGDAGIAEDLLQETFAAVVQRPEPVLSSALPRAYLFGIARKKSAQAFRGRTLEVLPVELPEERAETEDPKLEVMREAIARLEPAMREVLELRLQAELSYKEVAAALEIPVGTVRSRLHHAVQRLRQALKCEGAL